MICTMPHFHIELAEIGAHSKVVMDGVDISDQLVGIQIWCRADGQTEVSLDYAFATVDGDIDVLTMEGYVSHSEEEEE